MHRSATAGSGAPCFATRLAENEGRIVEKGDGVTDRIVDEVAPERAKGPRRGAAPSPERRPRYPSTSAQSRSSFRSFRKSDPTTKVRKATAIG